MAIRDVFSNLFKGDSLGERLRATPPYLKQLFNPPAERNYLPREGHKFVPGGNQLQAPIGSELLRGTPYGDKPFSPPFRSVSGATSSVTPTPTATPIPTVSPGAGFKLNIPSDDGNVDVPGNIAQVIGDAFDDIKQATPAAQVLHHPFGKQVKDEGRGENVGFRTGKPPEGQEWWDYNYDKKGNVKMVDNPFSGSQENSEDRGLFRINNKTFYTYLNSKEGRKRMKDYGIIDSESLDHLTPKKASEYYERMYDPALNAKMARIIFDKQGWGAWFAAPAEFVETQFANLFR